MNPEFAVNLENKYAKNEKLNKIIMVMFFIYIVIQPLLDTIYLYDDRVIALLGISPATVVRFLGIAVLTVMTFISFGFTKKFWFLFGYAGLSGIYFIFHCINAYNFNTLYPEIESFSIISEATYVFRFIIPACIVYIVASLKITRGFFEKAVTVLSATMSGLIVITNLFCISLDSYTNNLIKSNIFSWFTGAYKNNSFNGLASKAYFNFANMVSVIFCMLLPIILYLAFSKKDYRYYILAFVHSVAMLMLGTKTSTYGVALELIVCFLIYVFLLIVRNTEHSNRKAVFTNLISVTAISVIVIGVIFPMSPAIYRNKISTNFMENYDQLHQEDEEEEQDEENKEDEEENHKYTEEQLALKEKLEDSGIMSRFYINCYPFQYDMEFWENMTKYDSTKRLDSRFIEESMFIRIKEINANPIDDWLGITYSRTSRIYNLERDSLYQYYSLGLIGAIIFIAPYIILLIYGIIHCLRHFKTLCNLKNICLLFSIAITLGTGFYCGNTIDAPFANILLSFVCAATLLFLNQKDTTD